MRRRTKSIIYLALAAGLVLAILIAFYLFGPGKIVEVLGVRNTYLAVFVLALLAGSSSFTAFSFYGSIVALATTGLNPLLVALIGGLGITIGDSIFFCLGSHGRVFIKGKSRKFFDKFRVWIERRHPFVVPFIVFVYAGLSPLPNDIMTVALALAGYRFKFYLPFVFLGNLFYILLLSIGAAYGIPFLVDYFG